MGRCACARCRRRRRPAAGRMRGGRGEGAIGLYRDLLLSTVHSYLLSTAIHYRERGTGMPPSPPPPTAVPLPPHCRRRRRLRAACWGGVKEAAGLYYCYCCYCYCCYCCYCCYYRLDCTCSFVPGPRPGHRRHRRRCPLRLPRQRRPRGTRCRSFGSGSCHRFARARLLLQAAEKAS